MNLEYGYWLLVSFQTKNTSNFFPQNVLSTFGPLFRQDMALKPGPNSCSEICSIPEAGTTAAPGGSQVPLGRKPQREAGWRRKRSGSSRVVETSTGPIQGGMILVEIWLKFTFDTFFYACCMIILYYSTGGFTRTLKHIVLQLPSETL